MNKDQLVNYMVGGYFSANKGWKHNPRFHHGHYELVVCMSGPIYLSIGTEKVTLNQNDVLLVPPYVVMQGNQISKQSINFYWLHFLLPNDHRIFKNTSLSALPVMVTTNYTIIPGMCHLKSAARLIVLIHQLLSLDQMAGYFQQEADCLMTLILVSIGSEVIMPLPDNKTAIVINRLKEWIRANIYRSPSLEEIAQEVYLNPQYVSRLFKKFVGVPPKRYMIQLKINTAQALLLRTNLSVKEVAINSYFENEKLFMRQFKQNCGLSPSQFRDTYKEIYHNNQVISPLLPIPEKVTEKLKNVTDYGKLPQNNQ